MDCEKIYNEAIEAGRKAATQLVPVGMIVYEADLFTGKATPDARAWHESEGVCGFAWVDIRPASRAGKNDCEFVRWLRSKGIGSFDDYKKCWNIWIGEYNQSAQRKEAHAEAMAKVFQSYGIKAYAGSRLD